MAICEIMPGTRWGSQQVKWISDPDTDFPADENDFQVLFIWDENVTGFSLDDVSLSMVSDTGTAVPTAAGDLEFVGGVSGGGCGYAVTVRPPDLLRIANTVEHYVLTVTVNANAVNERNPRATRTIRVNRQMRDDDAVTRSQFLTAENVFSINPHSIFSRTGTSTTIVERDYNGNTLNTHTGSYATFNGSPYYVYRMLNGTLFSQTVRQSPQGMRKVDLNTNVLFYKIGLTGNDVSRISFSRQGLMFVSGSGVADDSSVGFVPFDELESKTDSVSFSLIADMFNPVKRPGITGGIYTNFVQAIADSDNTVYFFAGSRMGMGEITGNGRVAFKRYLNIESTATARMRMIRRNTLYLGTSTILYTIDITEYRSVLKQTKQHIPPIFASVGERINLKRFSPNATRIVFDVGYEKPDYLSIDSQSRLQISNSITAQTTTTYVALKAINYIDATPDDSFGISLIITRSDRPIWRAIEEITLMPSAVLDLYDLVDDALTITWRSGMPRATGYSISNGLLTVGSASATVYATATNSAGSVHTTFRVNVIAAQDVSQFSDTFRYVVEINGINVTHDLQVAPTIVESLDDISLNEYQVDETQLTLRSNSENGYRYHENTASNFWQANRLNPQGFTETIQISVESLVSGRWRRQQIFSGQIIETQSTAEAVSITCVDISVRLRNQAITGQGGQTKWEAVSENIAEAAYDISPSLTPVQAGTESAWSSDTPLTIHPTQLPREGPFLPNTVRIDGNRLTASGGFYDSPPTVRFKTPPRFEDVCYLLQQLAFTDNESYFVDIDIPFPELDRETILNQGSPSFSVENTTRQRALVDWVYDATNQRILMVFRNLETHVQNMIVQYDLVRSRYRVLRYLPLNVIVHRIERAAANTYYLLTSNGSPQDSSRTPKPNISMETATNWDSGTQGSICQIRQWNAATDTLTTHVSDTHNLRPQPSIHYWLGFENEHYLDTWEGINPDYRGAFKWLNGWLYYRYCNIGEYGVARVNNGRTVQRLIGQSYNGKTYHLHHHNNFAFDVNTAGTVYMAHCESEGRIHVARGQAVLGGVLPATIFNDLSNVPLPVSLIADEGLAASFIRGVWASGLDENGDALTSVFITGQNNTLFSRVTQIWGRLSATHNSAFYDVYATTPANSLVIKRRTADGTTSTIFSQAQFFSEFNGRTHNDGFTTIGVQEALFHNNQLYILAVVAQLKNFGVVRLVDTQTAAGMALYRCNVTAGSPSLTLIDAWDFVTRGACNLTVHDGEVHYVEHGTGLNQYHAINKDL